MKRFGGRLIALAALALLLGCSEKPPVDAQGKTPQQVLMETYNLILDGQYAQAQQAFSPQFIQALITDNNLTFVDYCGNIKGWQPEWMKTKLMGNDYNDDVWRVKLIPDEGKGKENRPGIVHDMHIVDGKWTIVFWGHYPKT